MLGLLQRQYFIWVEGEDTANIDKIDNCKVGFSRESANITLIVATDSKSMPQHKHILFIYSLLSAHAILFKAWPIVRINSFNDWLILVALGLVILIAVLSIPKPKIAAVLTVVTAISLWLIGNIGYILEEDVLVLSGLVAFSGLITFIIVFCMMIPVVASYGILKDKPLTLKGLMWILGAFLLLVLFQIVIFVRLGF